jgi:FKBP-type peptidyl-prolyl cis-trans isomerase FkpA
LLRRTTLALLLAVAVSACGGGDDDGNPNNPTPPPQGPATLQVVDVTVGTGAEATGTKLVGVHYVLYLYDPAGPDGRGRRLQASREVLGGPYTYRQGTNAVIPGFEQGVTGMRVGGARRVTVPPTLGYGAAGNPNGGIPGNSWLVFELELMSVAD